MKSREFFLTDVAKDYDQRLNLIYTYHKEKVLILV